jgi:hypothetical protein
VRIVQSSRPWTWPAVGAWLLSDLGAVNEASSRSAAARSAAGSTQEPTCHSSADLPARHDPRHGQGPRTSCPNSALRSSTTHGRVVGLVPPATDEWLRTGETEPSTTYKPPEPDHRRRRRRTASSEEAFRMDEDWGTLVWLAMTTGIEGSCAACASPASTWTRRSSTLRRNWVLGAEKDTKTHQNRRTALDSETLTLLREHQARVEARLAALDRRSPTTCSCSAMHALWNTRSRTPRTPSRSDTRTWRPALASRPTCTPYATTARLSLQVYAAWVAAPDRKGRRDPRQPHAEAAQVAVPDSSQSSRHPPHPSQTPLRVGFRESSRCRHTPSSASTSGPQSNTSRAAPTRMTSFGSTVTPHSLSV